MYQLTNSQLVSSLRLPIVLSLSERSVSKQSKQVNFHQRHFLLVSNLSFLFHYQRHFVSFRPSCFEFVFLFHYQRHFVSFRPSCLHFVFLFRFTPTSTVNPARLPTLSDDSHHWRLPHHMIAVPTSSCFNKSWYKDHFHAHTRFQNWQHIAESQQIVVRRPLSCLQYYAVFKSYTKDLNPPIFKKLFWHDYQHFQMMAGPCLI